MYLNSLTWITKASHTQHPLSFIISWKLLKWPQSLLQMFRLCCGPSVLPTLPLSFLLGAARLRYQSHRTPELLASENSF